MPIPGVDCHITLQHAGVNSGAAVGFILKPDRRGPTYEVTRYRQGLPIWADQGGWPVQVRCCVLALPRLVAPNGAEYGPTPGEVRARLVEFWGTTTPMTLADAAQAHTVMWDQDGLTEQVYGDGAEFRLGLVTV